MSETLPKIRIVPNASGPRLLWQVFTNRNPKATDNDPTWEMTREFHSEEEAYSFAANLWRENLS
jgi:hypothetical protein